LTERIPLTEDDFEVINYYHENDGKIKISEELKQQILYDYDFVTEMKKNLGKDFKIG